MQNSTDQYLSIGEASEYLGISIDTLRRWTKKAKVVTHRSPGGHRYFKKGDLDAVFGTRYERGEKASLPKQESGAAKEPEIKMVTQKPEPQIETQSPPQPVPDEVDFVKPVLQVPRFYRNQNISKYGSLLAPHVLQVTSVNTLSVAKSEVTSSILTPPSEKRADDSKANKVIVEEVLEKEKKPMEFPTLEKAIKTGVIIFLTLDLLLFVFYLTSRGISSPTP